MKEQFLTYEQALALKELGFDEPYYFATYLDSANLIPREEEDGWDLSKGIIAPLYQQAFRWFRKNHGLYSSILPKKSYPDNYVSGVEWYVTICGGDGVEIGPDGTYTYEEAELECLDKLIEIVGTIELFQHPPVFSENGNELLFDEEGNLIKKDSKLQTTVEGLDEKQSELLMKLLKQELENENEYPNMARAIKAEALEMEKQQLKKERLEGYVEGINSASTHYPD